MSLAGSSYGDGKTTHFGSDLVVGIRDENANGVAILGSAAGGTLQIVAVGDDPNISIVLVPKGTGTVSQVGGTPIESKTVSTIATAGPVTYTPAQLIGGLILRDPAGAARSDVTPTAVALAAAIPGVAAGTSFDVTIRNDAAGAFAITVTAGVGCTPSGVMTIAQNAMKTFRVVFTSPTAYTFYAVTV
jgi:hypothetical protein